MTRGTTPGDRLPRDGASTSDGGGLVFDDPLDRQTSDDTDEGWGDERWSGRRDGGDDADLDRFLQDKPPHHL